MKKYIKIVVFIFLLMSQAFDGLSETEGVSSSYPKTKEYRRIISLLPSTTEILFALDLGDQVVGVTKFCKFPPEAQRKTIIGGLLDINFEIIYRLQPDLVVISTDHQDYKVKFKDMGINVLEVETKSVSGIIESIKIIGSQLNREKEAADLTRAIQKKIDDIQAKTKDLPKPRVLITFLRPVGEGEIRDVYIAGNLTYFNDLIRIVGAENAYQGTTLITSPVVSAEGILRMDPDIIIEVMSTIHDSNLKIEDAMKDWDILSEIRAYKNRRIYILTNPYMDIPGPRLIQALDDIARTIHPQINWN